MNLLKSIEFLLKSLYLRPFRSLNVRGDFRIFSNLLVSSQGFTGNFGKNIGKRGIFINEALARRAYLTGKQNAQQQAGLPDGVDDLCRPVGLCVVILELMLAIPTHKAHQADPGDKKQNTGKTNDRSTYTAPIDLGDVQ